MIFCAVLSLKADQQSTADSGIEKWSFWNNLVMRRINYSRKSEDIAAVVQSAEENPNQVCPLHRTLH